MKLTFQLTLAVLLLIATARGDTHTFTANALIGCGNTTWEAFDVVVSGCTLTVDCAHSFHSLTITNSGVVRHTPSQSQGMTLTIADNVTIDAGSRMDVTGCGFGPNMGPGRGFLGGHPYGGGAGYGGVGSMSTDNGAGGIAYGSLFAPIDLGSGGGDPGDGASAGGGAILLTVQNTLTVNGAIAAEGTGNPSSLMAGKGSGGSIYIHCGTLTGSGFIIADGGSQPLGYMYGGGGGGGRIACYYGTNAFSGQMSAAGGRGAVYAGAGTIYTKSNGDSLGTVTIDNHYNIGTITPLRGVVNAHMIIESRAILEPPDSLVITGNLVINPLAQVQPVLGQRLKLTVLGDATIHADASLMADERGWGAGLGTGSGSIDWHGYGSGGGYGGHGGTSANGAIGGLMYGTVALPLDEGSGGGNGGAGGGAIHLAVQHSLLLDGTITANGGFGNYQGGGGSGGSIYLSTHNLSGLGTISANGGNVGWGYIWGGGGAGGRIAIYACSHTFSSASITANGGNGVEYGQDGSIFWGDSVTSCGILNGAIQDCNYNWIPDATDIANGTSLDVNHNGIPDECESVTAPTLTIQYTDDSRLLLRWTGATGAMSYSLYGKHGPAAETLIATQTDTLYDASALLSGSDPQLWVFRVTGVR